MKFSLRPSFWRRIKCKLSIHDVVWSEKLRLYQGRRPEIRLMQRGTCVDCGRIFARDAGPAQKFWDRQEKEHLYRVPDEYR